MEDVQNEGRTQCKLVLAYNGVKVIAAYRPEIWMDVQTNVENFDFLPKNWSSKKPRIGFVGKRATDVWDDYVGKRVPPRKRGAIAPFRYLVPNKTDPESPIEADEEPS